jgi:hypothetical protein
MIEMMVGYHIFTSFRLHAGSRMINMMTHASHVMPGMAIYIIIANLNCVVKLSDNNVRQ